MSDRSTINRSELRRKAAREAIKDSLENSKKQWIEDLKIQAEHKELPELLSLAAIGALSGHDPEGFALFILKTNLEITEIEITEPLPFKIPGATRSAYKAYLQSKGLWPVDGLLANWWSYDQIEQFEPKAQSRTKAKSLEASEKSPHQSRIRELNDWEIYDPRDTPPKYPYYTPARYFAREFVADDSSLLDKPKILHGKIAAALYKAGIKRIRGGEKKYHQDSIKKALANFDFSKNKSGES